VALVGDFNDWDATATPLRSASGAWSVAVRLVPGRHSYAFVLDGVRWIADPLAPPAPDDDFGSPGSVVTVGA
jgi:1,4-alpha-glucan branching enzyme